MKSKWIVQSNLRDSPTLGLLRAACSHLEIEIVPVSITPGDTALPSDLPNGPLVAHGATTLINLAMQDNRFKNGVFYDQQNFCHNAYANGYGNDYVNRDAVLVDWQEAISSLSSRSQCFVKPPDDLKSFTGFIATKEKLMSQYQELSRGSLPFPKKIVLGPTREIDAEWRLFVVEGSIVSGSMYRPSADSRLPVDLMDFAKKSIKKWQPAPVFAIDFGIVDSEWKLSLIHI